mmetsp:Transcript_20430/g.64239  ORF Transcript_20430/g.64239 Transcript_20430/m.64239 type:complete len:99 (+) Transcript_20430:55-351(+)|eukprot:CAMPEP_0197387426 /NCGR_PEP_ID=MMETSP1165-20131217/516_1 /TAXON_ID=284809 /ORGANISM="Chrysocystis fragilis, Strain CCMP3189" /LENGTH=98 /DNA_ID=CAMNT_0042912747 /DNA_START=40 /DNA_END=336 /DNA_ORIENTATION=-
MVCCCGSGNPCASGDEPVDAEARFKSSNVIVSKLTFPPRRVDSGSRKKNYKAQVLAKEQWARKQTCGDESVSRVSLVAAGTVAIAAIAALCLAQGIVV